MKLRALFAGLVLTAVTSWASADSLAWNDPTISDGPCADIPAIAFPSQFITTLKAFPKGFRVYLPFGNKAYYRWVYQKVNGGAPATSESDILLTKPRVTFPYLLGLFALAVGKVDVYADMFNVRWYEIQAAPRNLSATDLLVNIVNASSGSAPYGFGGINIPSRIVWADSTAFVEWHCFSENIENIQVVNVISLNSTLTSAQISAISSFLQGYGFQPQNLMTMSY